MLTDICCICDCRKIFFSSWSSSQEQNLLSGEWLFPLCTNESRAPWLEYLGVPDPPACQRGVWGLILVRSLLIPPKNEVQSQSTLCWCQTWTSTTTVGPTFLCLIDMWFRALTTMEWAHFMVAGAFFWLKLFQIQTVQAGNSRGY